MTGACAFVYVLQQRLALLLRNATELDSIVTPPVELPVDQNVELGLAGHPLGVVVVTRKVCSVMYLTISWA